MRTNLVAKLTFHLEARALFDALKLHVLEHAINLVLVELCFKELGDGFKHLSLKLLAGGNKFVMVVLVKRHIKPLECKCVLWLQHVAKQQGFGGLQHLLNSLTPMVAYMRPFF